MLLKRYLLVSHKRFGLEHRVCLLHTRAITIRPLFCCFFLGDLRRLVNNSCWSLNFLTQQITLCAILFGENGQKLFAIELSYEKEGNLSLRCKKKSGCEMIERQNEGRGLGEIDLQLERFE